MVNEKFKIEVEYNVNLILKRMKNVGKRQSRRIMCVRK